MSRTQARHFVVANASAGSTNGLSSRLFEALHPRSAHARLQYTN